MSDLGYNNCWRGVVDEFGKVWGWPTLLMDHNAAFAAVPQLRNYRARFRQWAPGGTVDFDSGASERDKAVVRAWVTRVTEATETADA